MVAACSSLRTLDFHSFKSALRHFCFADHHRFPPHSLLALAWSGFVSRQHQITYSLFVCSINQMDWILLMVWCVRRQKNDFQAKYIFWICVTVKERKTCFQHFAAEMMFHPAPLCLTAATWWTFNSSAVFRDTELLITCSRVKDHPWLVDLFVTVRKQGPS